MTQRYAQLRTWLDALPNYVELPERPTPREVDEALETGIVWLQWTQLPPPNADRAYELLRAYDALELLALLARINYDEWLRVITEVWPRAAKRWTNVFYPTTFELGVAVHITRGGELSKWAERAFLSDVSVDDTEDEYLDLRAELETEVPKACTASPEIRVRVVLHDDIPDRFDNITFLLYEAVQLAMAQMVRRAIVLTPWPRSWASFCVLVDVQVDVKQNPFYETDLLYVGELSAYGIRVPEVRLFPLELTASACINRNIWSLQRMVAAPVKHKCVPVERVAVDLHARRETLDGIFSSILVSQSLREIWVTLGNDRDEEDADQEVDHTRLMQWLALCAFGRFGCSSLDKITLYLSQFDTTDILTLKRTLVKDDAFPSLFGERVGDPQVVVTASTFVLTHPAVDPAGEAPHTIEFDTPLERLQVLAMDREWVSVLLPGWGQAWVPCAKAAISQLGANETVVPVKLRPTRYLGLEADNEEIVLALLHVVGAHVRALRLRWEPSYQPTSEDWVRAVCLACPDLEELYLEGIKTESLRTLARCYHSGICHASRLVLQVVDDVEQDLSGPYDFFSWLTEQYDPLYVHLRDLTLTITTPHPPARLRRLMPSIMRMLKHNRLLWKLDMTIHLVDQATEYSGRRSLAVFDTIFERFDDQNVAVEAAPLPHSTKLAFLSVLRHAPALGPCARCAIDVTMVTGIFEFAAVCKKRHVHVTVE